MTKSSEHHFIQLIYVASWVPVLGIGFLLAWQQPFYWPRWGGLVTIAIITIYWLRSHFKGSGNWFLIVATLNLFLLTPEIYLRQSRFFYTTGIQFGYPGSFQGLQRDADLFWTLPTDEVGVNSWGFRGEEVVPGNLVTNCRLLILGDSVPAQGYAEQWRQRWSTDVVDIVDLSLAGYSSQQGRALTDKYGAWVAPDIVFISYGWNDHWLAYQTVDAQKEITAVLTLSQQVSEKVYHEFRSVQWFRRLFEPLLGTDEPLSVVRVPYDAYIANLTYMGHFYQTLGATLIFVTPPTAHTKVGVPDYLVERQYAPTKQDVLMWHQTYNEGVRQLTAVHQWPLLDLANDLTIIDNAESLFLADGIHLTERGVDVVSQQIADFMSTYGCLNNDAN